MRIHLKVSQSQSEVPFEHLPLLVGTLHKWLGPNNWHSQVSLHSFSWLKGSIKKGYGLYFPHGAEWFISAHDNQIIQMLIEGIQKDPVINHGLVVRSVTLQETPRFGDRHSFTLASPILIKRRVGEKIKHFLFTDSQANDLITETLRTKLKIAGLNPNGVQVTFNRQHSYGRTKLVKYNGIGNKANLCPITITGAPEQIAFAWNVGIGNSTGIGFGALN